MTAPLPPFLKYIYEEIGRAGDKDRFAAAVDAYAKLAVREALERAAQLCEPQERCVKVCRAMLEDYK